MDNSDQTVHVDVRSSQRAANAAPRHASEKRSRSNPASPPGPLPQRKISGSSLGGEPESKSPHGSKSRVSRSQSPRNVVERGISDRMSPDRSNADRLSLSLPVPQSDNGRSRSPTDGNMAPARSRVVHQELAQQMVAHNIPPA